MRNRGQHFRAFSSPNGADWPAKAAGPGVKSEGASRFLNADFPYPKVPMRTSNLRETGDDISAPFSGPDGADWPAKAAGPGVKP